MSLIEEIPGFEISDPVEEFTAAETKEEMREVLEVPSDGEFAALDERVVTLKERLDSLGDRSPAITATADVWFRPEGLSHAPGEPVPAWGNSGIVGIPVAQATGSLQPKRGTTAKGVPAAIFDGTAIMAGTMTRTLPRTTFTVCRPQLPTTVGNCPFSSSTPSGHPLVSRQSNGGWPYRWYLTNDGAKYIVLDDGIREYGKWVVVMTVINGANSKLSINGDAAATVAGDIGTAGAPTNLVLGGYMSTPGPISVAEHIEFPGVLSAENQALMIGWLLKKHGGFFRIVCDGSSLTEGVSAITSGVDDWPSLIMPMLEGGNWLFFNFGVGGQNLGQMNADVEAQIDNTYNPGALANILIAEGPTNSIYGISGNTLPGDEVTLMADWAAYCAARREAGYEVWVTTIMNRTDVSTPAGFNAMRLAWNVLLRAQWRNFADGFIDLAADPRLSDPNDTDYFQGDKVHLSAGGNRVFARLVANALAAHWEPMALPAAAAQLVGGALPPGILEAGINKLTGGLTLRPGASQTPVNNGDVVIEFTDASTITLKGKSGGTVKAGTVALS